ncbi:hypothetical protein FQN50_000862 [Emmonsiellopsis sp. PD_5]|nr:hypothetical protein FQN50_000862 [Emmonsiellopsis sp. PD_5]
MSGSLAIIISGTRLPTDDTDQHPSEPFRVSRYILRIPREPKAAISDQISMLSFLKLRTKLPSPDIVHFDLTNENATEKPYMIQRRIPGVDLQGAYPTLPHAQRCCVVYQIARICREMQDITSPIGGCLTASPENLTTEFPVSLDRITVSHLRLHFRGEPLEAIENTLKSEKPLDMLLLQFQRWSTLHTTLSPGSWLLPRYFAQLEVIAEQMDALDCFGGNDMVLCHTDLSPRNIMVDTTPDGSIHISGILDWDEAIFGPRVMSCLSPSWIWQWQDNSEEDETKAPDDPEDVELRELKSIFEKEVGEGFTSLAYPRQYRLARKLCHFALYGIHCKEHMEAAHALFNEWRLVKQEMEGSQG